MAKAPTHKAATAGPVRSRAVKAWRLAVPPDFVLWRDVCSYGYFVLEPNLWIPGPGNASAAGKGGTFRRVLDLGPDGPVTLQITQAGGRGTDLTVVADVAVSAKARQFANKQLGRMLRLDESAESLKDFHALDPRHKRSGRGRLFRSASFFEDVLKTVTSCNVTWPSTVVMNRKLCATFGRAGAFPLPEVLARQVPATLRAQCSVGYRDTRIVQLAEMFRDGAVNEAWLADPATPDDDVRKALIEWPGVGPYAAANIMQLLGRYGHVPLDSESVRHGKTVLKMRGSPASIMKRVGKHFSRFGPQRFRSYWFELWEFYEAKQGPAWTWQREKVASAFTASALKAAMDTDGAVKELTVKCGRKSPASKRSR